MSRPLRTYRAWAIAFAWRNDLDRDPLMGIAWTHKGAEPLAPVRTALFATRKEALAFLRPKKAQERTWYRAYRENGGTRPHRYWRGARVVRVTVEILA